MKKLMARIRNAIRWRLGLPGANEMLRVGSDKSVSDFYNSRVTYCKFVTNPNHYEYPRYEWIINQVEGKALLEIGCGDGGMTEFLSKQVETVVAMDVSKMSLNTLKAKKLPNVETVESLIEDYKPVRKFDWIVMSEVLEHLRDPGNAIKLIYNWLSPGGVFLITTPHGYWESDEHLHEFSTSNFFEVLNKGNAESMTIGYLRDVKNRRRWLTGILRNGLQEPSPNDFFSRQARLKQRNKKI